MDIAKLKIGDKVHYLKFDGSYENGRVKEIPEQTINHVRVVYNCAGNWDDFMEFTSALTSVHDLGLGWRHD